MTTAYFFGNLIIITNGGRFINDETAILITDICEKNQKALLTKSVFYEL